MIRRWALVLAAASLAAGCHRREISTHDREEAANEVSEAAAAADRIAVVRDRRSRGYRVR